MAWVAIGTCVANMGFTIIWALVRRPAQRIDRLETAVFGESGVNMKLTSYLLTDTFEKRMRAIDEHLKGVIEEGVRREDRILTAITNQGLSISHSIGELKHDLRSQAARVDALLLPGNGR